MALARHYLHPGGMYFGEEPTVVTTLLGSCVAVTLYSKRLKLGSICHGVLPSCRKNQRCRERCLERLKYVDCAIAKMLDLFRSRGAAATEIEVKVFGGSDMFEAKTSSDKHTVGVQNVKRALEIISSNGLEVVASDFGGLRGRKIHFYTHTGEVLLERLHGSRPVKGAAKGPGRLE